MSSLERWSNKPTINTKHSKSFVTKDTINTESIAEYQNKVTTVQTPKIIAYVEIASSAVLLLARHAILPDINIYERLLKRAKKKT